MYQCFIPARLFLAVGVGLLTFSLVLGWISFSVPDWLQFYERSLSKNISIDQTNKNLPEENFLDLKKFGLWYKCTYSIRSNDFMCTLWNRDAPSFVRVAQVLIPFGLSLGCLAFLSALIGFISERTFVSTVLFAGLFAFLSFVFTTIGITVFATESLVYVERLRLDNNENARRWGMWLIVPSLVLTFLASICFILGSILNWCDYRHMHVTGILSHSVDKFAGNVFKAPSESNITSTGKKGSQFLNSPSVPGSEYPTTSYQFNNSSNNSNQSSYPPPPNYVNPLNQQNNTGTLHPGMFGYSRAGSPTNNLMHPLANFDPYYPRNHMIDNSEMDDFMGTIRSRRRSRSRPHSGCRSRSHSPRDRHSLSSTAQDNATNKTTQFIPIPVPYFTPAQTSTTQNISQTTAATPNMNNMNNNMTTQKPTQTMPYILQQTRPQYLEETAQPMTTTNNGLGYTTGQQSVLVSTPTQPVYTIAYRANNGGSVFTSNLISGAPTATYVTTSRNSKEQLIVEKNQNENDSEQNYDRVSRTLPIARRSKNINNSEAWTWRKL